MANDTICVVCHFCYVNAESYICGTDILYLICIFTRCFFELCEKLWFLSNLLNIDI